MSCHISEAAQTCCSEQAKSLKLEINVCWQIISMVSVITDYIPWPSQDFKRLIYYWAPWKKIWKEMGGEIKKRSEVFIYWGSLRWHYKPLQPLSLLLLLQNNYPVTTALPNFSKQTHRYIYNKWYSNLTKDEVLKLWHALKLLFWSHVH